MLKLPHNFLKAMELETQIKTPNLSRYFNGDITPRPERALLLSDALKKQGVQIPPGDFYLKKDRIKSNIISQLKHAVPRNQEAV